jgi:hypothetical protein
MTKISGRRSVGQTGSTSDYRSLFDIGIQPSAESPIRQFTHITSLWAAGDVGAQPVPKPHSGRDVRGNDLALGSGRVRRPMDDPVTFDGPPHVVLPLL